MLFFIFSTTKVTATPYWQIWKTFVGVVELSSKTRWYNTMQCDVMWCWLSVKLSALLSRPEHADAHIHSSNNSSRAPSARPHCHSTTIPLCHSTLPLGFPLLCALMQHFSALHSSGQRVRVELRWSELFYRISKSKDLSK